MEGAFKSLKQSDVFLTSYVAKKQWGLSGRQLWDSGITEASYAGPFPIFPPTPDVHDYTGSLKAVQANIDYYKGSLTGSYSEEGNTFIPDEFIGGFSGSLDLTLQTTIPIQGGRRRPNELYILSIPRDLIGECIEEGSFHLEYKSGKVSHIFYDCEGLILEDGLGEGEESMVVGDIIYNRGLLLFNKNLIIHGPDDNAFISWVSKKTVYTLNIDCRVEDRECNYTLNPSVTGECESIMGTSEFTPYITSVGLYNRAGELMAVAKVSKPIRKMDNIDTTVRISMDIS